jgi:antitoxin CptB
MRELDAVLESFLEHGYPTLGDDDKARFEAFLELPDPDLYGYLIGRDDPEDGNLARIVDRIRSSVRPAT